MLATLHCQLMAVLSALRNGRAQLVDLDALVGRQPKHVLELSARSLARLIRERLHGRSRGRQCNLMARSESPASDWLIL